MAETSSNSSAGTFLSIEDARQYLQEFLNYADASVIYPSKDSIVAGQVLGLENLKNLIGAIDAYNGKDTNTVKIDAVRVYYTISKRTDDDKKMNDILLVPVLANGKDVRKVFPDKEIRVEDNMLLGKAVPCPNLCNTSFNRDCEQ